MHRQREIAMDQINFPRVHVVVHQQLIGRLKKLLAGRTLKITINLHRDGSRFRAKCAMRIHIGNAGPRPRYASRHRPSQHSESHGSQQHRQASYKKPTIHATPPMNHTQYATFYPNRTRSAAHPARTLSRSHALTSSLVFGESWLPSSRRPSEAGALSADVSAFIHKS